MDLVRTRQTLFHSFAGQLQNSHISNTIAVFDETGNITSLLGEVPEWQNMTIISFRNMEDLFKMALRHRIEFILFNVSKKMEQVVELISKINSHMVLAIIPTIIYHHNPTREEIKKGLSSQADDFIWGNWDGKLLNLKVKLISNRSYRHISINPTSRLPGPVLIEHEVNQRLTSGEKFAVCYLDIDDFKAYNDYRGYFYGDRVIRLVAHIIRDVVFDLSPESFVGHIGGDDFIFLISEDLVPPVCSNIIKTFDRIIPYRYEEKDREQGYTITTNRRGVRKKHELMTISIAVLISDNVFKHLGEMSHMLADLKTYTKSLHGSNYMIERRKKY